MEALGNILKTLLIAAVVYTLALGAPVKRYTSSSAVTSNTVISNTVTEACEAATLTRNLTTCSNTTWNVTTVANGGSYDENYAAEILWIKLQEKNFNGAVCEAVQKCLNNTDFDPQKCKLAVAAMKLQDTIKRFIAEHGTKTWAQTLQIHCCTSTNEEEVEKTLCDASVYTQKILAGIRKQGRNPYSNCEISINQLITPSSFLSNSTDNSCKRIQTISLSPTVHFCIYPTGTVFLISDQSITTAVGEHAE